MKKLLFALVAILCLTACHKDILSSIDDLKMQYQNLDSRVTRLENLCKEMNTNITGLQTIVDVLQSNDYITGITEIKKSGDIIGYTITFGKHSPITIYNGEDGKDGKDGADGSSFAPTIGVQKDTDGVYYWTLNGSWLLDDQGNKLRVTGEKGDKGDTGATGATGQNGTNGTDGVNGANGQNGQDGITPQLKIEEGFWFVSYNGGTSWTMVGRATGEQGEKGDKGDKGETGATGATGPAGQNGQDGAKGDTGDSMFSSVTYDANYVYFTLADGTVITISKGSGSANIQIIDGTILAPVSVSATKQVYFSTGMLQYNDTLGTHLCADGTTKSGTWRIAPQFAVIGNSYNYTQEISDGWIDEFQWGSSGFTYMPTIDYSYLGISFAIGADISYTLHDWAWYNSIENGQNNTYTWRTLKKEEYEYIKSHSTYFSANINGRSGTILYPDNYVEPAYISHNPNGANYYNLATWEIMAKQGAIFIPTGKYWTSTFYQAHSSGSSSCNAWSYYTTNGFSISELGKQTEYFHVRPVRDVQ